MGTDRPADYASWPAEVQQLYDTVVGAWASNKIENKDAVGSAMERLSSLMMQQKDEPLSLAAGTALVEIQLRTPPEELAARLFRDHGQLGIETATQMLSSSIDEGTHSKAEELLKVITSKFPPKSRA